MASASGVQECRQGPSTAWRRASRRREGFGMGRAATWAPYPQKQQQSSLEEEACLRVSGPLLCVCTCPDPVWPGGPSFSPDLAPRLAEAPSWAECITGAHGEPRFPVAFLLVKVATWFSLIKHTSIGRLNGFSTAPKAADGCKFHPRGVTIEGA